MTNSNPSNDYEVFQIAEDGLQFTFIQNLTYTVQGGQVLRCDVFFKESEAPSPIILSLYGGGFTCGDKAELGLRKHAVELCKNGYTVIVPNYRYTTEQGDAYFPEFVKDIHTAVKWAKKNAAMFSGDAARIGVMGYSVGGYIGSLVARTPHVPEFKHQDDGLHDVPAGVQVCACFYSPQDLSLLGEDLIHNAFGRIPQPQELQAASPVAYAQQQSVPTLLLHNAGDDVVPVENSRCMMERLRQAGVAVHYYEFDGQGHELNAQDMAFGISAATIFFTKYLNGRPHLPMPEANSPDAPMASSP